MPEYVTNTDKSRLPELDDEGRVPVADCVVVSVKLMLPKGATAEDVRALMRRVFHSEVTIMHWTTNLRAQSVTPTGKGEHGGD